ncbi:tRNA (adenosine(37)-N6)-threonylcarbamoyltransferase complex dimerization subunit type 1 TsaB [Thalassovita sp.]|uniref:tRNA (adenosine(37)-N6)-threonylcarbamoyltransferase complex dimerization subunit type 1 TsaB n=1 Tax=Thalassovita sp. TaxID=1979401 RepID=UPI0029DE7F01|nr:tRNA (adenosine(37)-N6)-threonylcarbamoyltransferase complex dimerization subunit type 1 TsaB [Thalassovita sp.]
MSDPVILAFDTSAAHCAAALLCGEKILATRTEEMGRGQAERLFPLLEEVLAEAGTTWADLNAIGVGVGPGNFTGIRISVASARGLSLALKIPAIGVSTFDVIALDSADLPAVPGPRGQVYIRRVEPELVDASEILAPLAYPPAPSELAVAIARCAHGILTDGKTVAAPAPLYVKPADAAPSRDAPPVILDDA